MKLRSVIAAAAAVAVAATTTITSFAAAPFKGSINEAGMIACLLSDDVNVPLFTSYEPLADFVSVKLTVKAENKRDIETAIADGTWVGGGFIFNSNSTGWQQHEWSFQEGAKELTFLPTDTRGVYTLTYTQDKPIFAPTDTYAQVCVQNWSEGVAQFEIVEVLLLNSKGEDIRDVAAAEPETPAEPDTPAEPTEEVAEPTEEETEPTEEVYTEEAYTEETYTEEAYTEEVSTEETEPTAEDNSGADTNTDTDNGSSDDKKGSPDTGVAGVAVAAGVVALAGAAVVVARKRK